MLVLATCMCPGEKQRTPNETFLYRHVLNRSSSVDTKKQENPSPGSYSCVTIRNRVQFPIVRSIHSTTGQSRNLVFDFESTIAAIHSAPVSVNPAPMPTRSAN